MIPPSDEIVLRFTRAEVTQIIHPVLAEQPYRLVWAIMQKIGMQMQAQQPNGLDRAVLPSEVLASADQVANDSDPR